MYDNTIKAENKIISSDDLLEIFESMNNTLTRCIEISNQEKLKNTNVEYFDQVYTYKDNGSKIKVIVDFYDNTNVTFDNYNNFISIFNSRLSEIKTIDFNFYLYYEVITPKPNRTINNYSQSIHLYIREHKLDITANINTVDNYMNDTFELIKNKIINAPEKYDDVIRNKSKIINTVTFGMGLIPGIIISIIPLFIPVVNSLFFKGYVIYPLCALLFSFFIGSMLASMKLDSYYSSILPDKKYAGFDTDKNRSVYKDDVDSFINTSEILIGKNINNLDNRNIIRIEYEKYKSYIPMEFIVLGAISILVIVIGLFI